MTRFDRFKQSVQAHWRSTKDFFRRLCCCCGPSEWIRLPQMDSDTYGQLTEALMAGDGTDSLEGEAIELDAFDAANAQSPIDERFHTAQATADATAMPSPAGSDNGDTSRFQPAVTLSVPAASPTSVPAPSFMAAALQVAGTRPDQ